MGLTWAEQSIGVTMSKTKWYQRPIQLLVVLTLVLSLCAAVLPTAGPAVAQAPGHVLVYYGNGGPDPGTFGGWVDYYQLKARYDGQGYPTDYTDVWPVSLTQYKLVILSMPGYKDDSGTHYFTASQVNALQGFMMAGGRLVVLGDYGGSWGMNTVNDLLSKLGVGISQNADAYLAGLDSTPATDITADQVTTGVNSMQFGATSSLSLSGGAKSLVREPGGATLVAVDQVAGAPSRPCHDVVVSGDTQIMDDAWFADGDGDNLEFIDNLVFCCVPLPPPPPNLKYLHSTCGLFNLTEPVGTQWHELLHIFGREYHLSSWEDNGDGILSYCDTIDMYEKPNGELRPYHVETVTITLVVTPAPARNTTETITLPPPQGNKLPLQPMYIELEGGYDPSILIQPLGSQWHEIYPVFCREYELVNMQDSGDPRGELSFCDDIVLQNKRTGEETLWHVEEVAIDIIVTPEPPPVGGEAYPVDKFSLLAPWITVAVILAGGISWYILRRRRAQS